MEYFLLQMIMKFHDWCAVIFGVSYLVLNFFSTIFLMEIFGSNSFYILGKRDSSSSTHARFKSKM